MNKKYAIVDLETTGGVPTRDRIIEIGIVLHNGEKVIDKYQTLVDPERHISATITRITGITNDMVVGAPKFYEVAKQVIEITDGAVFVAHNVRFDYHFLRQEFSSLGYTYTKKLLCTVKLSRKAFPSLKSYSLGNLIKYFKIEVNSRHRAFDDAWATTIILKKIFDLQDSNETIRVLVNDSMTLSKLPRALDISMVDKLPEACGVYYMSNQKGFVIYIGKSINIRKRIRQHFAKHTKKTDKLFNEVADITYEITGSELAAFIKESREIKDVQPSINKLQKTRHYNYAITKSADKSGYYSYKVVTSKSAINPLSFYGSRKSALAHIETIGEQFNLCPKVNGLDKSTTSCFNHGLRKCKGACIGEEPPAYYNERFMESLKIVNKIFEDNFVVLENGRNDDERAVFLIENGHYRGYGYIDKADAIYGIEELKECIRYENINPEADVIIRNYIYSHVNVEIVHF